MAEQAAQATLYDALVYTLAFVLAAAFGLAVAGLDRKYRSKSSMFYLIIISGFSGAVTVGVIVQRAGATAGYEPYYLAMAAAVGSLGKIATGYIRLVLEAMAHALAARFGVNIDDKRDDNDNTNNSSSS